MKGRTVRYIQCVLFVLSISIMSCGPKPGAGKDIKCINMIQITKVRFTMGYEYSKTIDDKPVRLKQLNPFFISATEITNARYAQFLNDALGEDKITVEEDPASLMKTIAGNYGATTGKPLVYWINSRGAEDKHSWLTYENGAFGVMPGKEKLPVVAVTWYGAYAFAVQYGFRLPTEAEWECVAKGGKGQNAGTRTGKPDVYGKFLNFNDKIGEPSGVGSYPPNSFGIYDLSGNVREWCLDSYNVYYYKESPEKNPFNKVSPALPDDRVIRGGAFNSPAKDCMSYSRGHLAPDTYDNVTGFRVVLSFFE